MLWAADGQEAVHLFKAHRREIVCAVLDLAMTLMDGKEALRELLRLQPDLRVIICSGCDEQRVTRQLKGLTDEAVMRKPCRIADLAAKLQALRLP